MLYLCIILGALLVAQYIYSERRIGRYRAAAFAREDTLLNRIQAPQVTAAQSLTDQAGPLQPAYIPPFDEDALAEYESERDRLAHETRALVLANTEAE